jgi:phosphoenolpyruvate-protein kinase (PTS system EI component)
MAKKQNNERTYQGIGVSPGLVRGTIFIHRVAAREVIGHDVPDGKICVLAELPPNSIVVAHDLSPADTLSIDRKNLVGLALDVGDHRSHTAAFARSIQVPAAVSLVAEDPHVADQHLEDGQQAILDGFGGTLIVDPSESTLFVYKHLEIKRRDRDQDDKD